MLFDESQISQRSNRKGQSIMIQKLRARHLTTAAGCILGALLSGCSDDAPEEKASTVIEQLLNRPMGLVHSALPPLFSHCGEVQPDWAPDTYDPTQDGFCTVTFTREYVREGDTIYMDEHIYTVEMGEPDPAAEVLPWMNDGALYCRFRSRVDPEPFEQYDEGDAQHLRYTYTEISDYCTTEWAGDGGYEIGDTAGELAIRSTSSDVWLFNADQLMVLVNNNPLFGGYAGIPDSGGVTNGNFDDGGVMTFYETCSPEASDEGPGICTPACRLFSPSDSLPLCTWSDIPVLPADESFVDPSWRSTFPELYSQVYGHE